MGLTTIVIFNLTRFVMAAICSRHDLTTDPFEIPHKQHFGKVRLYWAVLLFALGVLCTPLSATAAPELVVGATVSLEGRYREPSRMIQLAYRLWERQVNQSGGILGRKVRLVLYNDKSRKELVRKYYEQLILEDKVDLVLAPYGTGLTYTASEITEKHGYVLVASAASGEVIWDRGYKFVFGVYGVAKRYFIGFLDLIARHGFKSVVIVNDEALFTTDAAEGSRYWSKRLGLKVQMKQSFSDGAKEIPEIAKHLEQIKPEAILLCAYPPDGYLFLEHLAKTSLRPRAIAISIAPSLPDFYKQAGPIAEGIFGPSQWEPDERAPFPGTTQFIKLFTEFAGTSPSYHAGAAYAGCQLLERSIVANDGLDHVKVRDYISALDTVTVIGRFKVDPTGRQVGHNTLIIQWQDGKKEIVYPRKMQTAKPRFVK
jgi:branched-chain amino acid transport system substrate-binding protein